MYRKILTNESLSLKERFKRLFSYYLLSRGTSILWSKRFKLLLEINPSYRNSIKKSIEKSYKQYWKPFKSPVNLKTLRISHNISDIPDARIIPEEVFRTDIEPTLNSTAVADFLSYKSIYNHWDSHHIFPQGFFHNIEGDWLDKDLNSISFDEVKEIAHRLEYPVVVKPNRDSFGGKDICFPKDFNELITLVKNRQDLIVQEKINQHSFFDKFNHHGLNTIRVYVYRSVIDNKLHVINMALRMGVGGSLDNETAGGIVTMVRKDGFLNGYAVDKYGTKYLLHPDTGVPFDSEVPDIEVLKKIAINVAHKIFYTRLVGLDFCYDKERRWRVIEVNIFNGTIRFAQYHGALFFGEFSEEVYNYCLMNHWALKISR